MQTSEKDRNLYDRLHFRAAGNFFALLGSGYERPCQGWTGQEELGAFPLIVQKILLQSARFQGLFSFVGVAEIAMEKLLKSHP
jgi:hypothetical protein